MQAMKIIPLQEIPHPAPVIHPRVCFVSMTPTKDGGYHSAYREFAPHNPTSGSDVRYQKYTADFHLDGDSRLLVARSEDPRVFTWLGRPLAWVPNYLTNPWSCGVVDLITGEYRRINHPLAYSGKNWMPVPDGGRLFFVRSVDPVCVLESDFRFNCKVLYHPSHANNIGPYHGGCAATMHDGQMIRGLGHKTIYSPRLIHTPFKFELDLFTGNVTFEELEPDGFGDEVLNDPTCILPDGRFLGACATTNWELSSSIPTRLCEIV